MCLCVMAAVFATSFIPPFNTHPLTPKTQTGDQDRGPGGDGEAAGTDAPLQPDREDGGPQHADGYVVLLVGSVDAFFDMWIIDGGWHPSDSRLPRAMTIHIHTCVYANTRPGAFGVVR